MLKSMRHLALICVLVACGKDDHKTTVFCTQEYCVTPGKVPILPKAIEVTLARTMDEFSRVQATRGKVFTREQIVADLRRLPLKIRMVEDPIHETFCNSLGCLGYTIGRDDIRVVIRNSYEADCMAHSYLAHEILHALLWRFDLQANLNPDLEGLEVSPRGTLKHASLFFYEEGSAELRAYEEVLDTLCPL